MSKKIFDAAYAPAEEIDAVKAELTNAGIEFREVVNSKIWLGGGALYVNDADDYVRAREIIEAFQQDWRERARTMPNEHKKINWALAWPLLFILVVFILFTLLSFLG